jgi:hypothetical protein
VKWKSFHSPLEDIFKMRRLSEKKVQEIEDEIKESKRALSLTRFSFFIFVLESFILIPVLGLQMSSQHGEPSIFIFGHNFFNEIVIVYLFAIMANVYIVNYIIKNLMKKSGCLAGCLTFLVAGFLFYLSPLIAFYILAWNLEETGKKNIRKWEKDKIEYCKYSEDESEYLCADNNNIICKFCFFFQAESGKNNGLCVRYDRITSLYDSSDGFEKKIEDRIGRFIEQRPCDREEYSEKSDYIWKQLNLLKHPKYRWVPQGQNNSNDDD